MGGAAAQPPGPATQRPTKGHTASSPLAPGTPSFWSISRAQVSARRGGRRSRVSLAGRVVGWVGERGAWVRRLEGMRCAILALKKRARRAPPSSSFPSSSSSSLSFTLFRCHTLFRPAPPRIAERHRLTDSLTECLLGATGTASGNNRPRERRHGYERGFLHCAAAMAAEDWVTWPTSPRLGVASAQRPTGCLCRSRQAGRQAGRHAGLEPALAARRTCNVSFGALALLLCSSLSRPRTGLVSSRLDSSWLDGTGLNGTGRDGSRLDYATL